MRDESVDPRIDRMMAALYGELSEAEERAFHRLLEKDDALRAEWEELGECRQLLTGWKVEERVPNFVLVESEGGERPGAGWIAGLLGKLRGLGAAPAWGLATTAVAVLAFVIADSRLEGKVEREIASRLAELPAGESAPKTAPGPGRAIGDLAAGGGNGGNRGAIRPAVAEHPYVTRQELIDGQESLVQSLVLLLNEYGQRQDEEILGLLQAMYERVNQEQLYDYRQLSDRIDVLGTELLLDRDRADRRLEDLFSPRPRRDEAGDPTPKIDGEE